MSISIRPATVPAAAQESARLLMKLYDQPQRIDRPFKDEDDYLPPDGVLDRTEFPSARFELIDRLQLSDGRVTETELAGGLILGGPIGLVGAGLGVLGVGGGFALAVKTVFDSGKAGVALFKDLEAAFAQLK